MFYPGFLGIVVAPSNTGKTTFTLNALKTGPRPDWQKQIWLYTFDVPQQAAENEIISENNDSRSADADLLNSNSLANSPLSPSSPLSVSYESDMEESISDLKIVKKSYGSFRLEEIPANTFLILDELNDALQRFPDLIEKIENIFTTQAHHRNISVVCLCQTVLKTPIFRLLRLTHALSLQTQQGSNAELLRHLPLYKETIANLRQFLAVHQDRALFVTVYANPPFKYQILVGTLFFHIGAVNFLLSMNEKGRDLSRVSQEAAHVIKPLLEKGYKNGLAILPLDMIDTTNAENSSSNGKKNGGTSSEEERKRVLEENVRHMINLTAPFTQRSRYNALWYFIRNEANFQIDENTLLLFCGQYKVGLQKFLHALLSPSHLSNSHAGQKRRKLSPLSEDVVFMTAVLLQNPSFNEAKIANARLKKAAQKMRDDVELPIRSDLGKDELGEEEEEEDSATEDSVLSDSDDSDLEILNHDSTGNTRNRENAGESRSESEEDSSTDEDSIYDSDLSSPETVLDTEKPEILATFDSNTAEKNAPENSQQDAIGYVREPDTN